MIAEPVMNQSVGALFERNDQNRRQKDASSPRQHVIVARYRSLNRHDWKGLAEMAWLKYLAEILGRNGLAGDRLPVNAFDEAFDEFDRGVDIRMQALVNRAMVRGRFEAFPHGGVEFQAAGKRDRCDQAADSPLRCRDHFLGHMNGCPG